MELKFTANEWRLFMGIARMCLSHGMVIGLFGLAVEDLGLEYCTSHRQLRRFEARGLVTTERAGNRLCITLSDQAQAWASVHVNAN